jgi:hypothetical protein
VFKLDVGTRVRVRERGIRSANVQVVGGGPAGWVPLECLASVPAPQTPAASALPPSILAELKSREACDILSDLFLDHLPKEEIRRLMDPVLTAYKTPATEENRLRAGSVLIDFRKRNGVSEVDFLAYMSRSATPGPGLSFPQAAALFMVAYELDYPTPSGKRGGLALAGHDAVIVRTDGNPLVVIVTDQNCPAISRTDSTV